MPADERLSRSRSLLLSLWCLLAAASLVTLACTVLISHRPPGLFILVAIAAAAGWVYFAVTAALGTVSTAATRHYVAVPLIVFQLWTAFTAAQWIDVTFGIGSHGSVSVLLNLGIVLAFGGVGVPLLRVRRDALLAQ